MKTRMRWIATLTLVVLAVLMMIAPASSARGRGHGSGHGHGGPYGHFHHGPQGGVFIGVRRVWWGPYPYGWGPYPYWWGPYPYGWPYPAPYYGYAPLPVIVQEPPVYIQSPPPAAPGPDEYWYYCPSAKDYYPTVQTCPEAWVKVPPRMP